MSNAYALQNADFLDHIVVVCPKCAKRAVVTGGKPNQYLVEDEQNIRGACAHCGFVAVLNEASKSTVFVNSRDVPVKSHVLYFNSPCDPFFQLPVWYEIPTTHGSLWAYNEDHLTLSKILLQTKYAVETVSH